MDQHDIKNFQFILPYVLEGRVFVDVGANKGEYTDFFSNNSVKEAKIYSMELHPGNCGLLKNKYIQNQKVILLNCAASNVDGMIDFYDGGTSETHNIIGHDCSYRQNSKIGQIRSVRLDSLLKEEEKISMIKIDVEGAELLVLQGLERIIDRVDSILLECHLDEDWPQLRSLLLAKYRLSCWNIEGSCEVTAESSRPYQCFCRHK